MPSPLNQNGSGMAAGRRQHEEILMRRRPDTRNGFRLRPGQKGQERRDRQRPAIGQDGR
jgi:hypothetical protein